MSPLKLRTATAIAAAVSIAPPALAHPGPRVWLNVEGGRVTTYAGAYPPGDPSAYAPSRVFTQPLIDEGDGVWDSDFPGFQMVPRGTIPAGTDLSFTLPGPLLYYSPGDATHAPKYQTVASRFGVAGAPQFDVGNELFQSMQTGPGPASATYLAYHYDGSAGAHNHLLYTLLGDGQTATPGPDGVYALPLAFSAPGVAPSSPFYLLLGKNAPDATLAAAAALARRTLLLPGDADASGTVNFADLQRFQLGYGGHDAYPSDGDFNADGVVDRYDFKILLDQYGEQLTGDAAALAALRDDLASADWPAASSATAPEPAPAALAALAAAAGLSRRRSRHERTC
jgi:MYXO-CTERM domain-containing protein